MKSFADKIAVVTGGGTGMGRELVRQLAAEGCHVAFCDVSDENMDASRALASAGAPKGTRITTCHADVSKEADLQAFRDSVMREHETDAINLLFNNAGIAGGGSLIEASREEWDHTFGVCWGGVYLGTRTFLPMLLASDEGHVINTSSVNGFWASLGPATSHTAYSAAKFAVKGFTEALINDFKNNAPHLKASVVMPGHIGTDIVTNTQRAHGHDPKEMTDDELREAAQRIEEAGVPLGDAGPDQVRQVLLMFAEGFRDQAPVTAAEAATVILDGVRAGRWRILIGKDAEALDALVREAPEDAYGEAFMERLRSVVEWKLGA